MPPYLQKALLWACLCLLCALSADGAFLIRWLALWVACFCFCFVCKPFLALNLLTLLCLSMEVLHSINLALQEVWPIYALLSMSWVGSSCLLLCCYCFLLLLSFLWIGPSAPSTLLFESIHCFHLLFVSFCLPLFLLPSECSYVFTFALSSCGWAFFGSLVWIAKLQRLLVSFHNALQLFKFLNCFFESFLLGFHLLLHFLLCYYCFLRMLSLFFSSFFGKGIAPLEFLQYFPFCN